MLKSLKLQALERWRARISLGSISLSERKPFNLSQLKRMDVILIRMGIKNRLEINISLQDLKQVVDIIEYLSLAQRLVSLSFQQRVEGHRTQKICFFREWKRTELKLELKKKNCW